jgi:hypothetical protein
VGQTLSVTFAKIRDRVIGRIRDTDPQASTFAPPEIDQAIAENYLMISSRFPSHEAYTSSAFTISAGGDTFNLPTTVTSYDGAEYGGDIRIQLVSNRRFLNKCTVEEIDALRNLAPTTFLSIPYKFCIWEEKDQTVQGRCFPGALTNEVCNLFRSLQADDIRDFTATNLDTASILFSRVAADALVLYVSADLLGRMGGEDLDRRKLNPKAAELWIRDAERMIYTETARRNSIDDSGRTQRWVP